jgi:hypothetical protein
MDRFSISIGSRGSEDAHLLYPTETQGISGYTDYYEVSWCVALLFVVLLKWVSRHRMFSAVCSAPHDGAVYIHYGKAACPAGRTMLDGGLIAGAHYTYVEHPQLYCVALTPLLSHPGGPTDYMCMTSKGVYLDVKAGDQGSAQVGSEGRLAFNAS